MKDLGIPLSKQLAIIKRINLNMKYLVHDIFERVRAVNCEADEENVGFRVGKRPKTIILLLASSIPQSKLDHLARRRVRSVRDIVLKNSRDIFLLRMLAVYI
jgi:hypothetical protein